MKKRNKKLIAAIIAVAILVSGFGGYVYATKEVPVPEFREDLDLTLTENEFYLEEENYVETMTTVVEPYIEQFMTEGYVQNGETSLYYRTFETGTSDKAVVISHGFTEYADKYNEVVYYYLKSGYDVYIIEHRGHGNSTREVDDTSLVYNTEFSDYIEDFKIFMDEVVVTSNGDRPLYLYAHSMGGGIGVGFLETYPGYFDAAVLSTPMLDIKTGAAPEFVASALASVMKFFGNDDGYVIGYSSYDGVYNFEGSSTSSKERYDYYYAQETSDEKYHLNAASYAWLDTALDATKEFLKEENIAKIDIPVLLFQAETDSYIDNDGLYEFANGVEDITFVYVEGSKHQLFSTPNELLIPYFNTIFDFLSDN